MKLSKWAKVQGLTYLTAWKMFQAGQIKDAYQLPTGTIIIPEEQPVRKEYVVTYARVSSSENKSNLKSQSKRLQEFCCANGWVVSEVVEECASGLNDSRPKLLAILKNPLVTKVVVEHKDRLTRFGFNYIEALSNFELVVINHSSNEEDDLMQDFVSLVTSFCARLYGKRRSKRKTEEIIKSLSDD